MTCVLARVTRNILGTLDHRVDTGFLVRSRRKLGKFLLSHITVCQQRPGDRIALISFREVVSALILRGKHALPQLFQSLLIALILALELVFSKVAGFHADVRSHASALNHCGTCFLDTGNVTGTIDAFYGSFAVFAQQCHMTALLGNQFHITGGIACQLGHWCQTNGNTNGIHVQFLFRSRNGLEVLVHLCDHRTGNTIRALCLHNGVGKVKRYAGSCQLCRMNTITADSGSRIDNGCHFTAGLQQLEADDQSHVAGADHEDLAARLHTLNVHHGLCRTGTDNTRNVPALERDHVFGSTGGDDDRIAFIMMDFTVLLYGDFLIFVDTHYGGVQFYLNAQILCFFQKLLTNDKSTGLSMMLLGTEELVNLFEQLSAGALVFIEHDNIHAVFLCFDRCTQTRRSCTDDDQFMPFHIVSPPSLALRRIASGSACPPPEE